MPGISPRARNAAQKLFLAGDRLGVHILPVHYYSPVASRKQLRSSEAQWRRRLEPVPFAWDIDAQLAWVSSQAGAYPTELPLKKLFDGPREFRYGPIEAQFLYSWLRTNAPSRVVEIGSGTSTAIMSLAVQRNMEGGRGSTKITACDPYTADWVAELPHVTAQKVGGLDLSDEVLSLGAGDLLFIDSTHVVRTGSELAHIYLELIPELQPGVVIHIHDIYLPYLYPPDIYKSMFDWQETTLVAALLAGNSQLRVLACQSALFHDRPERLATVFPEFTPSVIVDGIVDKADGHYPSSLWLKRVSPS